LNTIIANLKKQNGVVDAYLNTVLAEEPEAYRYYPDDPWFDAGNDEKDIWYSKYEDPVFEGGNRDEFYPIGKQCGQLKKSSAWNCDNMHKRKKINV